MPFTHKPPLSYPLTTTPEGGPLKQAALDQIERSLAEKLRRKRKPIPPKEELRQMALAQFNSKIVQGGH